MARRSTTRKARRRRSRADASIGGAAARTGPTGSVFVDPQDVESAGFEWTRIEAVVEGGKLTYYVNGKLVNAASRCIIQRRPDHDSVGRRGDLFPPHRAAAAAVSGKR